jgi:hypothetical protein
LDLGLQLFVVQVVDVNVNRTELAFVVVVDWDRTNATLPIDVPLYQLLGQRLSDNSTLAFCFTVPPNSTNNRRAVSVRRPDVCGKQSFCL